MRDRPVGHAILPGTHFELNDEKYRIVLTARVSIPVSHLLKDPFEQGHPVRAAQVLAFFPDFIEPFRIDPVPYDGVDLMAWPTIGPVPIKRRFSFI